MGYKTCKKQIMELRQQKSCWNKAWDLVLKECIQFRNHFLLWYISFWFTLMYIVYFNFHYSHQCRYSHYTIFFNVCRWNKTRKMKKIDAIKKTFLQMTQVTVVGRALTSVPTKNDDLFGYQCKMYFFK